MFKVIGKKRCKSKSSKFSISFSPRTPIRSLFGSSVTLLAAVVARRSLCMTWIAGPRFRGVLSAQLSPSIDVVTILCLVLLSWRMLTSILWFV